MDGRSLPQLTTEIPGPLSRKWVDSLSRTECPAITARRSRRSEAGGVDQDPIVWEAGSGANIRDVDGNVYVDITSSFAVAGIGHSHPVVAEAAAEQARTLPHAMGDVYPARVKIALAERLAQIAPGDLEVSIFGMSGAESVEAAIKSAVICTGKSTIVSFQGSYHGLSLGALAVTGYRREFKAPFKGQIAQFGRQFPFPNCYRCPIGQQYPECNTACLNPLVDALDSPASGLDDVAAVLVEPIQGRGGMVVPPDEWLVKLAEVCKARGILLIFDEIFTGFGRTGRWFAADHSGVVPDLMCLGKALGGGFPISAAIGTREVMGHWGLSKGEALHTSTFLGNPLGCAMAQAAIGVLTDEQLIERSASLETTIRGALNRLAGKHDSIGDVRGRGTMFGVEFVSSREEKTPDSTTVMRLTRRLLERGFLVLPAGVHGNILGITPPFVITNEQLNGFFEALDDELQQVGTGRLR